MKKLYHASLQLTPGTVSSMSDLMDSTGSSVDLTGLSIFSITVQPMGGDIRYSLDNNPPLNNASSPKIANGNIRYFPRNHMLFKAIPDSALAATEVSVTIAYV